MAVTLELDDIQGLVARGYGRLRAALYILLRVADPVAARVWLRAIVPDVTTAMLRPDRSALNLAFTPSGLTRLGLDGGLAGFSEEFSSGMTTAHRSRMLGDVDGSAPEHWAWGGPANNSVDLVLMLFAADATELAAAEAPQASRLTAGGLVEVMRLDTVDLGDVEHFGFHDGISQPEIEGLGSPAPEENTIRTGEFLLGYPNEYGLYTDRPLIDPACDPAGMLARDAAGSGLADFGRNGTYLVFRQLSQDVRGFWRTLDEATRRSGGGVDAARVSLAARMVGRWPSGAPLVETPDQDDVRLKDFNDFSDFQTDA